MITLKEHIELFDGVKNVEDIAKVMDTLTPSKKLSILRSVKETYPLKGNLGVTNKVTNRFKVYDNVFDLTLGQFIMIEQILTGKFKFKRESDMDIEIGSYLLRPLDEKDFDNTDPEKEKSIRSSIMDLPVEDFYSSINKFLKNRELVVFKQFSGVFYETPSEDEDDERKEVDTSEQTEASFNQQWYWYSIVRSLAQEDIRRYDEIYMLKMSVVLPEMSYLAQRNKIESAQQRAQAAMNRL